MSQLKAQPAYLALVQNSPWRQPDVERRLGPDDERVGLLPGPLARGLVGVGDVEVVYHPGEDEAEFETREALSSQTMRSRS